MQKRVIRLIPASILLIYLLVWEEYQNGAISLPYQESTNLVQRNQPLNEFDIKKFLK